jgi:hypothetical protein
MTLITATTGPESKALRLGSSDNRAVIVRVVARFGPEPEDQQHCAEENEDDTARQRKFAG